MLTAKSPLETLRQEYKPKIPLILKDLKNVGFLKKEATLPRDKEELKKRFPKTFGQPVLEAEKGKGVSTEPLTVGVLFSGGQAPGGHNVIAGLFDALKSLNPNSRLLGFLNGPSGVIEGKQKEITLELISSFRNMGGFDLIGSGRTKIETEEQMKDALEVAKKFKLDGLVIIGGDDSNTNAAILAEYFLNQGISTKVIGVPKTIDGDLKNPYVEVPFGFDTACKVYAEMIGNIARDALSAKKYYHFIKLMGRTASHITLECALATHPTLALIGEECAAKKKNLKQLVQEITDLIVKRAELGKNYGLILIPEGLIEFLPDMKSLISELNAFASQTKEAIVEKLSPEAKESFLALPESIQKQLLLERDPHGNIQVSLIETELLLINLVKKELEGKKQQGSYKGKASFVNHFFGYEGRAGFPTNFDTNYCNSLGYAAALLLTSGFTGYMAAVMNLTSQPDKWKVAGVPLTSLMHLEKRGDKMKPVIQKALVDLKGKAFLHFQSVREKWVTEDAFRFPGPIQFFGDPLLTDALPLSLII